MPLSEHEQKLTPEQRQIRFTVQAARETNHPKNYGYVVKDNYPRIKTHEDVEGVGYVPITPEAIRFVGWAKLKRHALQMAQAKNDHGEWATPRHYD